MAKKSYDHENQDDTPKVKRNRQEPKFETKRNGTLSVSTFAGKYEDNHIIQKGFQNKTGWTNFSVYLKTHELSILITILKEVLDEYKFENS